MKFVTVSQKILIVDDEAKITNIISKRLNALGYESYKAYDGRQCLKMAQEINPDLILLDIVMPHSDGITTFKDLRSNKTTKDIPIIFVTAYDDQETKSKVLELKADGFFVKPFDGNILVKKIKDLIGN